MAATVKEIRAIHAQGKIAQVYNLDAPALGDKHLQPYGDPAELPDFVKGLIQRGWPTGDIRKVLGENWLRVYEKCWGA